VPIGTGDFTSLQTAELAYLHFTCKSGSDNPTSGNDNPGDYIVACGALNGQVFKFLLGPAKVFGNEISSANTAIDSTGAWIVDLTFNSKGTTDWGNLTTEASKLQTSGCGPPAGCNYIAVVLDGVVNSWPTVNQGPILSGNTQITNIGGQTQAQALANVLKYGSLPVHVHLQQDETVSPTLGSDQLRGGLIAGAIGLGLVIVYSLLYYRGLGFVTIASLALSGALLYALVTILGVALGYTLTLAGIAGFIVAVGITADSFVVFFERMRDVRREGRSLRSSVEFAWPRARRTILSADTVSILAAAVLYLLSIGDVRGFAFTLGLSTICDLFIVFLFTKPLLTLLVNTRFYQAGGRFTGLGDERIGSAPPPRVLAGRQG
jgi:preprotein translocase subunit SecD